MSNLKNYCPTARGGGTCTDSTCSKRHDVLRCDPCDCYLPTFSFQEHQSGRKHRQNVASKGLANPGTPQLAPPSQSTPSSRHSILPGNTLQSRDGASDLDVDPPDTGSGEGGPSSKMPYCASTLQGETCPNSRCQYRHDVVRCEPCGRSYPASLLGQHKSGRFHQGNVASNGSTNQNTSQNPHSSQPAPLNPEPIPPQRGSSLSGESRSIPAADLLITVSHEDGLDFVAEGTGSAAGHSFPSISHTISIENTSSLSNLSVKSMKLAAFPSQCFSASLLGKTVVIQQGTPRKIRIDFKAPQAGAFHAILKITFSDKARPNGQGWVVTRELRGVAILPTLGGLAGNGDTSNTTNLKDKGDGGDTGINVFPYFALDFSVECARPHESFPTETKDLFITKTSPSPLVSFTAARVYSLDPSMVDSFVSQLQGDSMLIKPKEMRRVSVSFTPRKGGLYGAVLQLNFHDHKRKADFVVERALTGWAERPPGGQGHNPEKEPAHNMGSLRITDEDNDRGELSVDEEEEYLESDGTGISVSHEDGLDFGIVERKRPNGPFATPSSLLTIEFAAGFPSVTFVKEKTRTLDGSDSEFVAVFEGDSINIHPGKESTVRVIFSPKFEGVFKTTLELVFYHSLLSTWFAVRRTLRGVAGSLNDYKHIESVGQGDEDEPTLSDQEAPPLKTILLFPPDWRRNSRHLPDYEVPTMIQEAVDNSTTTCPYNDKAPNLIFALRPDSLATTGTYVHYFEALLFVEDGHQQWDVLCQPPYSVNVYERDQRYDVEIENVDEDLLPEVSLGDLLWLDAIQDNIRYEASVNDINVFMRHHLAVLKMSLRLPPAFNLSQRPRFVLRFRHNRITLRRQYRALITSFPPPRRLLFPSMSDIKPKQHLSRAEIYNLKFRHLINRRVRDDPQQLRAVVSILEQPKGSVPFIIYGPPGTGKTSTVVESIVQLVRRDAEVRVLACTPSNAAADYLVERLAAASLDLDKLHRLIAPLPHEEDASEDAKTFSQYQRHEKLLAFRVVVSTCSEAGVLQNLNVPVGHFSHIFIDEAAQADEPLVMIPIMTFSDSNTNVILAGDPNQLGPNIRSPTAARSGLRRSYFERLMLMNDVYGLDTQVGKTIVVLQRNWRSHGAIIAWSNRYLYEDSMRDYGNAYITYHLVHSAALPKKGFPIVFHAINGSEQCTESSPSHFDVLEASIVRNYCVKLVRDPQRKIYPKEIGVLAPYKIQVRVIRELLKVAKLSDISVGPVEQFQGQERKVIILATTRSNEEDHPRRSLGVLLNRQRMNVAITRAQALLIVIGDPEVLVKYEHWRTFLKYIKSRKGWAGKMHDWESEIAPPPGYEIISRKGGVVYGEEFIDGKSEKIYRTVESGGG